MNFAEIISLIIVKGPEALAALVVVLSGLIALFMLIPGDEPEKTLQKIVDFIKRFSAK